ncbi:hypothetical protein [Cypionkella sp. TWP1-2-1b2]|uniref:hypothetical protein n=1 Tax=Cypionkella sp. TWP1-2-1b2 TaxID=2804675 RepID=UPI003CF855AC
MTHPQTAALQALLERVEAGDMHPGEWDGVFAYPGLAIMAYEGSLDAAKALHEAVADKWTAVEISSRGRRTIWVVEIERLIPIIADDDGTERHTGWAETPARAWLIAILRALIAQPTAHEGGV